MVLAHIHTTFPSLVSKQTPMVILTPWQKFYHLISLSMYGFRIHWGKGRE
jgi:hypothetical protein